MNEFIKSLNLDGYTFKVIENKYVSDIGSSDDFAKVYSQLESLDFLELDDDNSLMSYDVVNYVFLSDNYTLSLRGDFVEDAYTLEVEENEKTN